MSTSRRPTPTGKRRAPSPQPRKPADNRQVNLQTRKVLSKHYRAKHGVK